MTQEYYNPTSYAMETTFKFPKDPETIISDMLITIGDKTIKGIVMEKQKAQEEYDAAIERGDSAVMLKEDDNNQDLLQLDVGNIQSYQIAKVKITMIKPLKIEGGGYSYELPLSYFPRYISRETTSADGEPDLISSTSNDNQLLFNFRATILS